MIVTYSELKDTLFFAGQWENAKKVIGEARLKLQELI